MSGCGGCDGWYATTWGKTEDGYWLHRITYHDELVGYVGLPEKMPCTALSIWREGIL